VGRDDRDADRDQDHEGDDRQERLGDPVPLFELVLTPGCARRAVPVLGTVAAVPMVVLAARRDARWDQLR
jgi:hypothetical protein